MRQGLFGALLVAALSFVPVVSSGAPPSAPEAVRGDTSLAGQVTLTWNPSAGATAYRVYRGVDFMLQFGGSGYLPSWQWIAPQPAPIATVTDPPYVDAGLPPLVRQYYVVTAVNADGESSLGFVPPVAIVRVTAPDDAAVFGFADLHSHPFAYEGFGGRLSFGRAFGPPDQALPWCTPAHGLGGLFDPIGNNLRGSFGHPVSGYDQFDGWPYWNDYTHQQMYAEWLERAYEGGLRLLVAHAVNNKLLCQIHGPRTGYDCEDMPAVDRQITAAKLMEQYIDAQSGGPGQGWFRIAYSAAQARQIINRGGLAVVLGIEVDELFGCTVRGSCPTPYVLGKLDEYYAAGVRHVFPVHVFDNGFGGAAMYEGLFDLGNKAITGDFFVPAECPSGGYAYKREAPTPFGVIAGFILGTGTPTPTTFFADCNSRSLTGAGEDLVRGLMRRKMIIDVDHMSALTAARVLTIAEGAHYPLAAGHTGLITASLGAKRHEGQKTSDQLQRLRNLGGVVAPILHQGATDEILYPPRMALDDCSHSSKTWAQAYLAAVDAMGGAATAAVGLGSDFNGFAGQPGPRYGSERCHGDAAPAAQVGGVSYPFAIEAPPGLSVGAAGHLDRYYFGSHGHDAGGTRVAGYDYNFEGLAHVGLLPDFVADLRSFLPAGSLAPLFRSAEAYLQMWERIERQGAFPPTVTATTVPPDAASAWQRSGVTVTLSATPNPNGGSNLTIRYSAQGATPVPDTQVPGTSATLQIAGEGATTLTFGAIDEFGAAAPPQTLTLRVDRTAPALTCAAASPQWLAANIALGCVASDPLSGLANPADASFALETSVPAGVETADAVTGTHPVADVAGNSATAGPIGGNHIDRKPPAIALALPGTRVYRINEPVVFSFACSDGGSGVATCASTAPGGTRLDTGSPGVKTVGVAATDNVGNAGSAGAEYTVGYGICLLYDPKKPLHGDDEIVLKLRVCDAARANLSRPDLSLTALGLTWVGPAHVHHAGRAGEREDDERSRGERPDRRGRRLEFRYAPRLAGYVLLLGTRRLSAGDWEVRFRVAGDPTDHAAPFRLRGHERGERD
jgi:microsomal dipeptidase-like Zn-dependent dipeptidase